MFQNEVANRLVALPRTKAYGRLSIITQLRSEVKILFKVPAASFTPQPKIESAVVKITPTNKSHLTIDHNILQKIVKLAFGQRRKMLRQSLKSLHPRIQPMLRDIGINPESRPEELSIEQFCCLATTLKNE